MGGHATPVRGAVGNQKPRTDDARPPASPGGDLAGEPPLPVERPDSLLHVHDGSLQLDQKECLSLRMPGQDVDDAPLPVDRERDLRLEDPSR
jgi:hypothetical protein